MSEVERLRKAIDASNAKISAERLVTKLILQTMLARIARMDVDPEQHIMTLIAPIVEGIDGSEPKDDLQKIVFSHATEFAQEIEAAAIAQLKVT
ncbi:hypothetical protein [Gymnodinialimonas sp.]